MANYTPGPSSSNFPNSQSQRFVDSTTGTTTFAQLPAVAGTSAGDLAYTTDQGLCYSNGVIWIPIGSIINVTANATSAASFNTTSIQSALTAGGLVQILTPGVVYINSTLIANSNTQLVLGSQTEIRAVPNSNIALLITSSLLAQTVATTANNVTLQCMTLSLSSTSGGTGYVSNGFDNIWTNVPLTTNGAGTGALATVQITGGVVLNVTITNSGTGYVAGDSISFADASVGGRVGGAAFTTTVYTAPAPFLPRVLVTFSSAHGYSLGDGIWIWGSSGFNTTTLTAYTGGSGYSTPGDYYEVAVTTGGAGTGMKVHVTIAAGAVSNVEITSTGTGYNAADSISFADANVGGRSGGAAFTTTVASIASAYGNPYNGVFRVAEVNSATTLTVFLNYGPPAQARGQAKAVKAVTNFRMSGGTWNFDYANNHASVNPKYNFGAVWLTGVLDCLMEDVTVKNGPIYNIVVEASRNFRYKNLKSDNAQGVVTNNIGGFEVTGVDALKIYAPVSDFYGDGLTGNCFYQGELVSIQTKEAAIYGYQVGRGGDCYNVHLRGLTSVNSGQQNGAGDMHLYATDSEQMDLIALEDVNFPNSMFVAQYEPPYTQGYIKRVSMKNIHIAGNQAYKMSLYFQFCNITQFKVDGISFAPWSTLGGGNPVDANYSLAVIAPTANISEFICSNMTADYASTAGRLTFCQISGTVGTMIWRECTTKNTPTSNSNAYSFLLGSAASWQIDNLIFDSCDFGPAQTYLFENGSNSPAGTLTMTINGCRVKCFSILTTSGGTFPINLNLNSNIFNNVSGGLLRPQATIQAVIRSNGCNQFLSSSPLWATFGGTNTCQLYGWDLVADPIAWATTLPGGFGTLSTTQGQFFTSNRTGTTNQGPSVRTPAGWIAIGTGTSGVNTVIA